MPQNCFFKIDGSDGSCTEKGFEKTTYCYEVGIESFFDFNENSASKAGDQKWKPIRLVCRLEETAPEWLQTYRKGKECKATLKFPVKDAADGTTKAYTVITLEQAQIVSWAVRCPNTFDPDNAQSGHLCELSLAARLFTISHEQYKESGTVSHRKTQDKFNFEDPTA